MTVAFIQSGAFLRSSEKTNPFFDPIITCAGDDWTIWMPKGEPSGYPAEHIRHYDTIVFWSTWFWRIVHVLCPWLPSWKVYYAFGRLARPFLREWAKADVIITITGLFADILAGAFPHKRIVDIQHGVIYSKHRGYFNKDGCLIEAYRKFKNREFWLYGQGYTDCFFKNPENHKWLDGRVKIIGDLLGESRKKVKAIDAGGQKIIAVSLQFTNDFGPATMKSWADDYYALFEQMERAGIHNKYPVKLRHHPRYNNSFDMDYILKRFPWLEVSSESTNQLIVKSIYHITYTSTTAFEYASASIPTFFVSSPENQASIHEMYEDFGYPIPLSFDTFKRALSDNDELLKQGVIVKNWYHKFYSSFDDQNCHKLIAMHNVSLI